MLVDSMNTALNIFLQFFKGKRCEGIQIRLHLHHNRVGAYRQYPREDGVFGHGCCKLRVAVEGAEWPGQSTVMLSGCPQSLQLTPLATPTASLESASLGHIDCLLAVREIDCSIVFVHTIQNAVLKYSLFSMQLGTFFARAEFLPKSSMNLPTGLCRKH